MIFYVSQIASYAVKFVHTTARSYDLAGYRGFYMASYGLRLATFN